MRFPEARRIDRAGTHRLIPSKYRQDESVLVGIADDDAHLAEIFALDNATNDRLLAQADRLPGIGRDELVHGICHAGVINAAFCHPHPLGSRFNGPDRGAWYAGFTQAAAQAEIVFHKSVALAEIGLFEDSVTYDDYRADFAADFHDLRDDGAFAPCLDPNSYAASQDLAAALLAAGSAGLVYPSVRLEGGVCIACFRPALVGNVRLGDTLRFAWTGDPVPAVSVETPR